MFDGIPQSELNVVCIGSMMKVLVNNGRNEEAMAFYHRFGALHNDVTNLLALKAAVHLDDHEGGRWIIENEIEPMDRRRTRSLELQNSMIHFFGHFGDLESAENVFAEIKRKTVAVTNCLMHCLVHCGQHRRALALYDEYKGTVPMDAVSLMLGLKAATKTDDFHRGQSIHEAAAALNAKGRSQSVLLQTALIDFYGHFGAVETAEALFHSVPQSERDIVCTGSMMKCLLNNGLSEKVLDLHDGLRWRNDTASHILALKACAKLKRFEKGRAIIDSVNVDADGDPDILWLNTLIDFLGESADIEAAERVFESIPTEKRDIVTVNAMMTAYFSNELDAECLRLFDGLLDDDSDFSILAPNNVSYSVVLKSCARSTALHHGQRVHRHLVGGPMERDLSVQINLINFYGKSGAMTECEAIFKEIERSEYSKYCTEINLWNIMIHSYSRNGDIDAAAALFEGMRDEVGLEPDRKTLVLMLNGFSYSGNAQRASDLWSEIGDEAMKYDEYIVSTMIDCLSRNNEVESAYRLILEYDGLSDDRRSNEVMWMSLMNGCRASNNMEIAQICYDQFVGRFAGNTAYLSSATVLMSNIQRSSLESEQSP